MSVKVHPFNFPGCSAGKESACNAGDPGSTPGLGRSPGEGIDYPLQYSSASFVAQLVKDPPAMQETLPKSSPQVFSLGSRDPREEPLGSSPGVGKIPWRRDRLSTPVFWPGEFHGL